MRDAIEVTALERTVLDSALRITKATSHQYQALMPAGVRCHPTPFFGPLARARVITLGLNPSAGEFAPSRSWPISITAAELAERLVNYWIRVNPGPHPWFQPWSTVLSELGVSYELDAAHVDLSSRATKAAGQFRQEPLKSLFLQMLQVDAPVWIEALRRAPHCSLVLAAGSATNSYYINEFIRDRISNFEIQLIGDWRRCGGEGQTAWHKVRLPDKREIPLFFCSTGPTRNGGAVLINACRTQLSTIRQFLNSTAP